MDKLAKDNDAAEAQLAELRAYAESISQEIIVMVSALEKLVTANNNKNASNGAGNSNSLRGLPVPFQRRGTLMGKNRARCAAYRSRDRTV